jgi:hypothetical protein
MMVRRLRTGVTTPSQEHSILSRVESAPVVGAKVDQWLSNLSPFETYLIAVPAIMLGSILFLGGIILLLGGRNKNDAETLEAIRKDLKKAGTEFSDRERTGEVR